MQRLHLKQIQATPIRIMILRPLYLPALPNQLFLDIPKNRRHIGNSAESSPALYCPIFRSVNPRPHQGRQARVLS